MAIMGAETTKQGGEWCPKSDEKVSLKCKSLMQKIHSALKSHLTLNTQTQFFSPYSHFDIRSRKRIVQQSRCVAFEFPTAFAVSCSLLSSSEALATFDFRRIRRIFLESPMENSIDQHQHEAMTESPPPGYSVAADIGDKEGEGGRLFACTEIGCDGFTFDTVDECQIHVKDWHNPPYSCSECEANFAAMPALRRHFKASGHYNWICQEEQCEMKGILFANRSEFVAHALRISGHERLLPAEDLKSPLFPSRINYAEIIHIPCDDTTSEPSDEEAFQCLEPSCRRYQHLFHSESEFGRHQESHAHVSAIKHSEGLCQSGKSVGDVTTEQEAAREFRCTAKGCPFFGEKLKTSQSFYRHINTTKHAYPLLNSASNPTSPTAEIRQRFDRLNLACDEPECPRYEHHFANYMNFTRHIQSVPHLKAVSYGQTKRSALPSDHIQGATQMSEESQSAATVAIPSTPVRWSSYSFAPITPDTDSTTHIAEFRDMTTSTKRSIRNISPLTPPPPSSSLPSWREESLVKKNEELEIEVRQLKDKMERLRSAYKEQISSLFQALGAEQARKTP
ncbi:hypothetical protein TRIATDRAFT_280757 [Trichoderma atroviride IMI 206040]|uniref:C2H2-type domain-containing protein n=1 Tax=Hypocrea atroviridis (strain ATCC 20476 / IMI 206040) TaxID=452589 RepID=G9NIF5_HYPAI|nr:uncharacterized protein TRIATDRAFT_280757 [Trichoderma atroviride IMI 206040]EHK49567.1 hypothetical protein TRIATDRAFT_280757 [Trichoderma atroviride IMI 206040]